MRLEHGIRIARVAIVLALSPVAAVAGMPRIDKTTCEQLHTEQARFIESGILDDLKRGAEWGKTSLSPERLREVEHYILLDEQIKFGCREESLTPEMLHAAEIAKRLELNSDADPFAPPPKKNDKKSDNKKSEKKPEKKSGDKPAAGKKSEAAGPQKSGETATKGKPALQPKADIAKPAAEKPAKPKPDQKSTAPPKSDWTTQTKRKLPKEANETPAKTPSTRAVQELNWPPQLWPSESGTP